MPAATLQRIPSPGMLDQRAADGGGGDREEADLLTRRESVLIQQLEVGLVNDLGRAERVIIPLAPELPVGDASQLVVDEREQPVERLAVASLECLEKDCDLILLHPRLRGGVGAAERSWRARPGRVVAPRGGQGQRLGDPASAPTWGGVRGSVKRIAPASTRMLEYRDTGGAWLACYGAYGHAA